MVFLPLPLSCCPGRPLPTNHGRTNTNTNRSVSSTAGRSTPLSTPFSTATSAGAGTTWTTTSTDPASATTAVRETCAPPAGDVSAWQLHVCLLSNRVIRVAILVFLYCVYAAVCGACLLPSLDRSSHKLCGGGYTSGHVKYVTIILLRGQCGAIQSAPRARTTTSLRHDGCPLT